MLASVVFIGAVLCAVGFMAWLAFFILNRGFNTMLETPKERWRNSQNSLVFGVILLLGAIVLGYFFFQMEPPLPTPPINAAMSLNEAPDAPGPSVDKTLVAIGIVLSGVAFVFWLGAFMLNRSFNASLRTARESRQSGIGQATVGVVLFCAVAFFVVVFIQMDRAPVAPEWPRTDAAVDATDSIVEPEATGTVSGAVQAQIGSIDRARDAAAETGAHAETADSVTVGNE